MILDQAKASIEPASDLQFLDANKVLQRQSPRFRQLMCYRCQLLTAELEGDGGLPVLADVARSILAASEYWHAPDLPLYPAFGVHGGTIGRVT